MTIIFTELGPMNSLLFGIYGNTLAFINDDQNMKQESSSLSNIFIAGTISGTLLSVPTNPLEVIRIQLQTHGLEKFHI